MGCEAGVCGGSLFCRVMDSPNPSRGRGCVALAATRVHTVTTPGAARGTGTRGGCCLSNAVPPLRRLSFGVKPQGFGPWLFPGCFSRCGLRWYPGAILHRSHPLRERAVGLFLAGNCFEDAAASWPRWPRDSGHQMPPRQG